MAEHPAREDKVQSLANVLSLIAIAGNLDNTAVQRVLTALGAELAGARLVPSIDRALASKLLAQVAMESGEARALDLLHDMAWVADAWRPVLDAFRPLDPQTALPYAEIIDLLVIHSGTALQQHDAFTSFGGVDLVLPLNQLTAALRPYHAPQPGLNWELVGFQDPPDQALVAGDAATIYLFKTHASNTALRFSELARDSDEAARREHDVIVDPPLFGAFLAGLLGDMLAWAARLRGQAVPGHELWRRIQSMLLEGVQPMPPTAYRASPQPIEVDASAISAEPAEPAAAPAGAEPWPEPPAGEAEAAAPDSAQDSAEADDPARSE